MSYFQVWLTSFFTDKSPCSLIVLVLCIVLYYIRCQSQSKRIKPSFCATGSQTESVRNSSGLVQTQTSRKWTTGKIWNIMFLAGLTMWCLGKHPTLHLLLLSPLEHPSPLSQQQRLGGLLTTPSRDLVFLYFSSKFHSLLLPSLWGQLTCTESQGQITRDSWDNQR